jgi:hypothetical protein
VFNIFHDVVKRLNGIVGRLVIKGDGAAGRNVRWLVWCIVLDMMALG